MVQVDLDTRLPPAPEGSMHERLYEVSASNSMVTRMEHFRVLTGGTAIEEDASSPLGIRDTLVLEETQGQKPTTVWMCELVPSRLSQRSWTHLGKQPYDCCMSPVFH